MKQQHLFETVPSDKYDQLSKEDLITLYEGSEKIIKSQQEIIKNLEKLYDENEQKSLFVEEQYINIKNKMFGKSSERSPKKKEQSKESKPRKKRVQLPSNRYPNTPLIEKDVELKDLPECNCCGEKMKDSGMTEDSEYLTAIPRKFFVVRQKRHKYRCSCCHGDIVTAPAIPKIKVGGSYSDEMTIDVAVSKYCDLIPVDRYAKMAERSGLTGLPPNSLIQSTHNLANFVTPAYDLVKKEVTSSKVLKADETPHRMLEGDKKSNWFLWGFSNEKASFFEARDTRSGDVASNILKRSKCEYLMSDVFSGYARAVRITNEIREGNKEKLIKNIYCNAHARRKFKEAETRFEDESKLFIFCYKKIYRLESHKEDSDFNLSFKQIREWQKFYFKIMERSAIKIKNCYSSKSSVGRAMSYFLKNYEELTLFLEHRDLPIDNNSQERLMRNPVIGRKTWYGTHSKKGARTSSILFSLVESCKLNKISPREYFLALVEALHQGKSPFTPAQYAKNA